MKQWKKYQHSERLTLANGFIEASIYYDGMHVKGGFIASVNRISLEQRWQSVEIAKTDVEAYIEANLNIALKQIEPNWVQKHKWVESDNPSLIKETEMLKKKAQRMPDKKIKKGKK